MPAGFAFFADLGREVNPPETGMISRTLFDDDHVKVLLFALAAGHQFSTHTAPSAVSLCFLKGEAVVTLGDEKRDAQTGTFVQMAPKLPHSIAAKTPVIMLLQVYKQNR